MRSGTELSQFLRVFLPTFLESEMFTGDTSNVNYSDQDL